ncbi:MAG: EF2563 family selenium-dependent molybdenum hydroxylase system protein [Chloroflexi bacterium]|nr:EF2563 family selenium-dependent molybdenum hydroxylase system protein [Chloroflexota bacterium]
MALAFFKRALALVRGGGDLASGVIYRLHRAGFPVIVTELEKPLLVRRTVSYGTAVFSGEITVQGVTAKHVASLSEAATILAQDMIAVIVDPQGESIVALKPAILVDSRVAKTNIDTIIDDAPLVIALGPGFNAGVDCHAVIETNRGHNLGRVIWHGYAEPDSGVPASIGGISHSRLLRAPTDGFVEALAEIGAALDVGAQIARVGGQTVSAPFAGVLRGLIHEGVLVTANMKIGDLDPRAQRENCFTISDKSLAIGGGVLEAVFSALQIRPYLTTG